jgi:spermidine/putrescine-binding protein
MDPVRALLDERMNRDLSRRDFVRGVGGVAGLAFLGPTALAACSPGSSASGAPSATGAASAGSSAAPSAELGGDLFFLGYDGEDGAEVAAEWLEENNITMQPTYLGASTEALTKWQTGGRGQLDVTANNHNFLTKMLQSDPPIGLFQPLDMNRIPNAAGLFAAFPDAPWVKHNGQQYSVPLIWGDEPVVYNPAKWDGVPAKYTDFADPKYKGEIVFVEAANSNVWLFSLSLGFGSPTPNRITQAELDQVYEAMLAVKPNVVTIAKTLGDQADVIVRGDASIGLAGWAYQISLAKDKGVTLAVAQPATDGTYYWCDSYAIFTDAPNIDNAYAYIDYMSSPESSAAMAGDLGSGACMEGALDLMDEATKNLYPYDIVRTADPNSPLYTTSTFPPEEDEGEIVGQAKWTEVWEKWKLA